MKHGALVGIGILIIVVVIIGIALSLSGAPSTVTTSSLGSTTVSSSSASQFTLLMTDPPSVPLGTQSLILSYTGIKLHQTGAASGSGFTNLNASGSVNLLSIVNLTQTLAVANVPKNESFDSIVFQGATATIKLNNVTSNVTIPSGEISAEVNISTSSAGGALVDLSPAIIMIYSSNGTGFIMAPQATAIALASSAINASNRHVGARGPLEANESDKLDRVRANISITGASLSESGNVINMAVTIKNNGNSSVVLKHLAVKGLFNGVGNFTSFEHGNGTENSNSVMTGNEVRGDSKDQNGNATGSNALVQKTRESETMFNISKSAIYGSEGNGEVKSSNDRIFEDGNFTAQINATIAQRLNNTNASSESVRETIIGAINFHEAFHDQLNFIIGANGSLSLPFSESEVEGPNGYNLTAGNSITLAFNSTAGFGKSGIFATLIPNTTYRLVVTGERGARAAVNETTA